MRGYEPAIFEVNDIIAYVKSSGVIYFKFKTPKNSQRFLRFQPCENPLQRLGEIRQEMLKASCDGRSVARILDEGYVHSLKIRGELEGKNRNRGRITSRYTSVI